MIRQPSPLESFNIAVALLRQAWNETVAKSPSKELLVAAEELTMELTGAVVELRLMRWGPTPLQYLPHTLGPPAGQSPPPGRSPPPGHPRLRPPQLRPLKRDVEPMVELPNAKRPCPVVPIVAQEWPPPPLSFEVDGGKGGDKCGKGKRDCFDYSLPHISDTANVLPPDMMAQLPQAALHDMLHMAVDTWLGRRHKKRRPGQNEPEAIGSLGALKKTPKVVAVLRHIQPPVTDLADWIAENMRGHVELSEENGEPTVCRSTTPRDQTNRDQRIDEGCQFFASLPDDFLAEEEQNLRDALINYFDAQETNEPTSLSVACQPGGALRNAIAFAKMALLPRSVKIQDWITNRVGGDILLTEAPQDLLFSLTVPS